MKNYYLLLLFYIIFCRAQDETLINNDSINETVSDVSNQLNETMLAFNSTFNLT